MQWQDFLWLNLTRTAFVLSSIVGVAIVAAAILVSKKLVLTLIVAIFAPITIRTNIKAQGEFGKSWFAAGAVEILETVTIAFAVVHGIDPVVQVYLLDRKILHHTITPQVKEKIADRLHDEILNDKDGVLGKLERLRDRVDRWFDFEPLENFVLDQRHFVRVDRLEGDLVYSLSDFAWTGMSLGILYTLAGLLAPVGTFRIEPKWEELTKGEAKLEFNLSLWPFRVLLNALFFTVMNIKLRRRKPKVLPPARTLNMEAQHGR